MKIPTDKAQVQEHPLAVLWFDEHGILHKISKRTTRTLESITDLYSQIKHVTKGKKVCAMIEVSREMYSPAVVREQLKKEIPQVFKAIAIISTTPMGKMIGTLMSIITPLHIPVKVFGNEREATEWLKQSGHNC